MSGSGNLVQYLPVGHVMRVPTVGQPKAVQGLFKSGGGSPCIVWPLFVIFHQATGALDQGSVLALWDPSVCIGSFPNSQNPQPSALVSES